MRRFDKHLGQQIRRVRQRRRISFKLFCQAMDMCEKDCAMLEEGHLPITAETLLRVVISLGVDIRAIWKVRPLRELRSANEYSMATAIRLAERRLQEESQRS